MSVLRVIYNDSGSWKDNGEVDSKRHVYEVSGAESIDEAAGIARQKAYDEVPDGMIVDSVELSKTTAPGVWQFTATFLNDEDHAGGITSNSDDNEWTFTAAPHMTKIIEPIAWKYRSPGAPSEIQGINFDGEQYNGVEVPTPTLTKTFTRKYKNKEWDVSFEDTISALLGSVNIEPWKGYRTGVLRFMECSAKSSGIGRKRVITATFKFEISSYAKNIKFHGFLIPEKMPWDYAFPYYRQEETQIDGKKTLIPKAAGVYVVQTHRYGNFGLLKL